MNTATPIQALTVLEAGTLPDGVNFLIVPCEDSDVLHQLPKAVSYDGKTYGRTGWNSDNLVAYFRTDAAVARPL